MTARVWSNYQQAVFDAVSDPNGRHLVVMACPGSGKTTLIIECIQRIKGAVLGVAFNKAIATEWKERLPYGGNREISTCHAFGNRIVRSALGTNRIDGYKIDNRLRDLGFRNREMRAPIAKAVSLAKGVLASTSRDIDAVCDQYGIETPDDVMCRDKFCSIVARILDWCAEPNGVIDFDDMIWLPIRRELRIPKFDWVFVDETQDLNAAQLELVVRAGTGGRIVAVGDERQAIYTFRGADQNAVRRIIDRLDATVLPLSVTYRCPQAVVEEARKIVPDVHCANMAHIGSVREASLEEMVAGAVPGDFVLSRTNAPLVSLAMRWIAQDRRAFIQGRDIGAGLVALVKKLAMHGKAAQIRDVSKLRTRIEEWRNAECARLGKEDRDTTLVEDKAACLLALSDGAQSVEAVVAHIVALFADAGLDGAIVLSSTHKAKGLERDRVWLLRDTYLRQRGRGDARTEPSVEEQNLYYVAVTRSKSELYLVRGLP